MDKKLLTNIINVFLEIFDKNVGGSKSEIIMDKIINVLEKRKIKIKNPKKKKRKSIIKKIIPSSKDLLPSEFSILRNKNRIETKESLKEKNDEILILKNQIINLQKDFKDFEKNSEKEKNEKIIKNLEEEKNDLKKKEKLLTEKINNSNKENNLLIEKTNNFITELKIAKISNEKLILQNKNLSEILNIKEETILLLNNEINNIKEIDQNKNLKNNQLLTNNFELEQKLKKISNFNQDLINLNNFKDNKINKLENLKLNEEFCYTKLCSDKNYYTNNNFYGKSNDCFFIKKNTTGENTLKKIMELNKELTKSYTNRKSLF